MFKQGKKVKQNPDPPKPCRVFNSNGEPYDYYIMSGCDYELLGIRTIAGKGFEFPSHARAHSAIHHTIEWLKSNKFPWSKEDFRVVDL